MLSSLSHRISVPTDEVDLGNCAVGMVNSVISVQRLAKVGAPGCVNAAGKLGLK